jgi:hypothetical protein
MSIASRTDGPSRAHSRREQEHDLGYAQQVGEQARDQAGAQQPADVDEDVTRHDRGPSPA